MQNTGNILLVDDDPRIGSLLQELLAGQGYRVEIARNAVETEEKLADRRPDLLLLEVMIPDASGLEIARSVRRDSDIPIIMLSGKSDPVDKVMGLENGADDYITKPFDQRELLARVRSVLRRSGQPQTRRVAEPEAETGSLVAHFEGWTLDLRARDLYSPDGAWVHLTSYEFRLLAEMVSEPNQTFDRNRILMALADRDWSPRDRSIDVLVSKLRKKIEADPKRPRLIKTVRGTGYLFAARVALSVPGDA
jgi:DNA-binding response OmpR family regulator